MANSLSQLTVMRTLVRREFWEQRLLFLYLPMVLTVLLTATIVVGTIRSDLLEFTPDYSNVSVAGRTPTLEEISIMEAGYRAGMLRMMYRSGTELHTLLLSLALIYYCLTTLFKQRSSPHSLFYSSMPVSTRQTVLSKALSGLVLAPAAYLLWALLMMIVLLAARTLHASMAGIDLDNNTLRPTLPSTSIVNYMLLYILSLLWCLPGYAWLLLCSAWAKQAPVAWAAAPFLLISLPSFLLFNNSDLPIAIASHFVPYLSFDWWTADASRVVQKLGLDNLLLSVIIGLAFLFAATKFNRAHAD